MSREKHKCVLYLDKQGGMRMTRKRGKMKADEIAVDIALTVPKAIFNTPALRADIAIPDEAASPPVIDASVLADAAAAVQRATGLTFDISVVAEKPEEAE